MKEINLIASIEVSSSLEAQKVFKILYDTPLPPLDGNETYVIMIFVFQTTKTSRSIGKSSLNYD